MRLIDAEVLWKAFTSADKDDIFDLNDIEEIIDNAPTVDAVSVVRCKDCKWYSDMWGVYGTR